MGVPIELFLFGNSTTPLDAIEGRVLKEPFEDGGARITLEVRLTDSAFAPFNPFELSVLARLLAAEALLAISAREVNGGNACSGDAAEAFEATDNLCCGDTDNEGVFAKVCGGDTDTRGAVVEAVDMNLEWRFGSEAFIPASFPLNATRSLLKLDADTALQWLFGESQLDSST